MEAQFAVVLFCVWCSLLLHGGTGQAECLEEEGHPVICAVCSDSRAAVRWTASRQYGQEPLIKMDIWYQCVDPEGYEVRNSGSCYDNNKLGVHTDMRVLLGASGGHDSRIIAVDQTFQPGVRCTFYGSYKRSSSSYLDPWPVTYTFRNSSCVIKEPSECLENPVGCDIPASCENTGSGCDCHCKNSGEEESCTEYGILCNGLKCQGSIIIQQTPTVNASGHTSMLIEPSSSLPVVFTSEMQSTSSIAPGILPIKSVYTPSQSSTLPVLRSSLPSSTAPGTLPIKSVYTPSQSSTLPVLRSSLPSSPQGYTSVAPSLTTQATPSVSVSPDMRSRSSGTGNTDGATIVAVTAPIVLVVICMMALAFVCIFAVRIRRKRLRRIPSHLDFGFMTEKINTNYVPVDANAPMKHATSMCSVFNSLEKQEDESSTHIPGIIRWSDSYSHFIQEDVQGLDVRSTCASQKSMSDFMEVAKDNTNQSAHPPKAFHATKPPTTLGSLPKQPASCDNGYTTEAMISDCIPRDSMNTKPTAAKPNNLAGQHLPPILTGSFQGGYVDDTTRFAPSSNVTMGAQGRVTLSDKNCHVQSLPPSSQDSTVGYTTEQAAMFALPSQLRCAASPRERDDRHGKYTTELVLLSTRKQQSTTTTPYKSNHRDGTGQLCPCENQKPQLLPPSAFTVPLKDTTRDISFTSSSNGSVEPSIQQTMQMPALAKLNSGYVSEASNMTCGIGTEALVVNLKGINASTPSQPSPKEYAYGRPSTANETDNHNEVPSYNPPEHTRVKALPQTPLSIDTTEYSSAQPTSSGYQTTSSGLDSQVWDLNFWRIRDLESPSGYTDEKGLLASDLGVSSTLLQRTIVTQPSSSQAEVGCESYTCTKPQEQGPLDQVEASSSARHPSKTMVSDHYTNSCHSATVAGTTEAYKSVSLKDHFAGSESKTVHSVLPQISPVNTVQVRERVPFTIALMHPKPMQREHDTSTSECERQATSAHQIASLNLQADSQSSSGTEGYSPFESHSFMASPVSLFDSEEDSSSTSQPDMDPLSVFTLPSSSEQAYTTSGYTSLPLSYSISDALQSSSDAPPHRRCDSGYTTHSDTPAGYTTHSDVPSNASSPRSHHNGFTEDEHASPTDSTVFQYQQANTHQEDIATRLTSLKIPHSARKLAISSPDSSASLAEGSTRKSIFNVLSGKTTPAFSEDNGYVSNSGIQCTDSGFAVVTHHSIEDAGFIGLQLLDSPFSIESLPFTDEH